jgi:protein TonB
METKNILSADILDILFEGRNKTYGAYELRKTYNKRIAYSLAGTFFLCLFFVVSSILANGKKKVAPVELATTIELENFKKDDPKPELQPPVKKEIPKVEMTIFNVPRIVIDELVKPQDEIKEMAVLEDTKIGPINQDGIKDDGAIAPPVETNGTTIIAPKVAIDVDKVFTVVQIAAKFPGDIDAWRKYLERNLNADLPAENGAPGGSYTVTVSFIVSKTGAISDVRAENDPGYGTKTEAIRVIQKGPDWEPAIQNGLKVIYRHRQNITFRVSEK